jgi:hypothetical protein
MLGHWHELPDIVSALVLTASAAVGCRHRPLRELLGAMLMSLENGRTTKGFAPTAAAEIEDFARNRECLRKIVELS